jgi:hypothetical protein
VLFWKEKKEREGNIKSEDVFSPLPSVRSNPAQWEKNIRKALWLGYIQLPLLDGHIWLCALIEQVMLLKASVQ